jgi:hypothetical protein
MNELNLNSVIAIMMYIMLISIFTLLVVGITIAIGHNNKQRRMLNKYRQLNKHDDEIIH